MYVRGHVLPEGKVDNQGILFQKQKKKQNKQKTSNAFMISILKVWNRVWTS